MREEYKPFPVRLSYAEPEMPLGKRLMIHLIELASGRQNLLKLYHLCQQDMLTTKLGLWENILSFLKVDLQLSSTSWPLDNPLPSRVVIIANHPYGILDGIAVSAIAEKLGRPFKLFVSSALLGIPELLPYALPIDFSPGRQAALNNRRVAQQAFDFLCRGGVIIVFPAGAVATASSFFGKAEDLPWKPFTTKLICDAEATVLPLYFPGQNGFWFHFASKVSETWRIALLLGELEKRRGHRLMVHVGAPIPYSELATFGNRTAITQELRRRVFQLESCLQVS